MISAGGMVVCQAALGAAFLLSPPPAMLVLGIMLACVAFFAHLGGFVFNVSLADWLVRGGSLFSGDTAANETAANAIVTAYIGQVEQVLVNLLENAARYGYETDYQAGRDFETDTLNRAQFGLASDAQTFNQQYKDRAAFHFVYIEEAHASDAWQSASDEWGPQQGARSVPGPRCCRPQLRGRGQLVRPGQAAAQDHRIVFGVTPRDRGRWCGRGDLPARQHVLPGRQPHRQLLEAVPLRRRVPQQWESHASQDPPPT